MAAVGRCGAEQLGQRRSRRGEDDAEHDHEEDREVTVQAAHRSVAGSSTAHRPRAHRAPPAGGPSGLARRIVLVTGSGEVLHDVLVVGGGPSGAAAAYWLASAGWDVLVVEKKHFPREKTCGDGLTPAFGPPARRHGDGGGPGGPRTASRPAGHGVRPPDAELSWPAIPDFPPRLRHHPRRARRPRRRPCGEGGGRPSGRAPKRWLRCGRSRRRPCGGRRRAHRGRAEHASR